MLFSPPVRRVLALFTKILLPVLLLLPVWSIWAVRPGIDPGGQSDLKDINPAALKYFQRFAPEDSSRRLDVAPLGNFTPKIPGIHHRKGLIATQVGFFNPKNARAFDGLPAELRPVANHPALAGKGLGLGTGVGIIQISEAALKNRGYDAIQADIRALGARILESRPDRALVVKGNDRALSELVKASFVEASLPYAPAFKIEPTLGRQPLLDRVRANRAELDVHIRAWDASDVSALLTDLKARHGDTVTLLEDGATIRATVTAQDVNRIAKDERVRNISEEPEYQLNAFVFAEHPPTVQVGENEHTGSATPYWDAGVDGGGCGNTGTGTGQGNTDTRNCSTAVPPTIVAILDNGASLDAGTLADSQSNLGTAAIRSLISAGSHRKIVAYLEVGDAGPDGLGTTCDSVLSGGQTHGNIVAGMIAGNATQIGYQIQMDTNLQNAVPRPVNFDGAARGARLTIQDAGNAGQCTLAEIVERGANVTPGSLTTRMNDAYTTGARLHVMAFGVPNWGAVGSTSSGIYTSDSLDLDTYLVNNLEYQVFVPVGNKGFSLINGRDVIPDFFDGDSSLASDGTAKQPLQISPPATAKNIVSVGATCEDTGTMFGPFDTNKGTYISPYNSEENVQNFTSKGPATGTSLRAAPIIVGVGNDRGHKAAPIFLGVGSDLPTSGGPAPMGMYSLRSRDNNQNGPVEVGIDQQARGTSFAAASVASGAAIMQDYLRQGWYPTGDRVQTDRVGASSGALIKAMLAASANFTEGMIGLNSNAIGMTGNDPQVATTRGSVLASVNPLPIGGAISNAVLVNNQQGYGRSIVSLVLPVANWPDVGVPADYLATADTAEYPALGLLIWDAVDPDGAGGAFTAEPPITNSAADATTGHEHHFQVLGTHGQIRACMAYPDPPGDLLVNDLDFELVDPNGKIYDGNVYNPFNQVTGQWGLGRTGGTDYGDRFNPIECVHLSADPDGDPVTADGQIVPGTWILRVKRGVGGAIPGTISGVDGTNEDTNGNNRLDANENDGVATAPTDDADGLLDKSGQVYAAVVSGPVLITKDSSNTAPQFANFPQSIARLDKIRYSCSDDAVVNIWDNDATPEQLSDQVSIRVYNPSGTLVDTESNLVFSGSGQSFASMQLAVRLVPGASGIAGNGILEGDTGYTLEVRHADPTPGSRTAFARAPLDCDPNFLAGQFVSPGLRNAQDLLFGGCDRDQFFDANEMVTYSVALTNWAIEDEYTDVTADLAACAVPWSGSTCATPSTVLTILDTPKNIGRIPAGQPSAVTFSIQVSGTPLAQGPRVYLRLALTQTSAGKLLGRLAYNFTHAMGADRESLHYSTDYPDGSGGAIQRDLDRNLIIEPNDRPGLTLGQLDEAVAFSSLFSPLAGGSGPAIHNVICTGVNTPIAGCPGADEAYPALGSFDPAGDTNTNGILDRHVLSDASPAGIDLIPWNFDFNNGGWTTQRDASSIIGASTATRPLWHWVKNGTCGFQTQSRTNCLLVDGTPGNDPDGPGPNPCGALTPGAFVGGAWHTGSGVAGVCSGGGTPGAPCYLSDDCTNGTCTGGADNPLCGNYGFAFNAATARRAEFLLDYWMSPVIEKVNQGNDASGFPFTVEFQRLAYNNTIQLRTSEPAIYVDMDNNIDSDNPKAIIRAGNGPRGDGWQYYVLAYKGPIDQYNTTYLFNQRTFGPRTDPDASLSHCSITTTTPCTDDAQCTGGAGVCGKLTGDESGFSGFDSASTNYYAYYNPIPTAPSILRPFPGPGEVHVGDDTVAGPSRSREIDMVDFEDNGLQFFTPGDAGNRFQIALAFLHVETTKGAGDGDFGIAVDDVVFEWDEVHPVTEATSSCSRVGNGGPTELAAGCKCATLSVDRTNLYDCDETIAVTVDDSRYAAGAAAPCLEGNQAAPDLIQIRAYSNSEPYPGELETLSETGNATGVFKGSVQVSGIFNSAGVILATPGVDTNIFLAYEDSQCDSNQNHVAGQSGFENLDGDGIQAASGRDGICGTADDIPSLFGPDGICGSNPALGGVIDDLGDNCALVYNPLQNDADGDKVGGNTGGGVYFGCDNCPSLYNPDQADSNQDGVGNACDLADFDADGVANALDNCPVTYNPTTLPGSNPPLQADANFNGIGDACEPAGSFDENRDGLPDDVAAGPFYALAVACGNVPLAQIAMIGPSLRDRAELGSCPGGPTLQACAGGSSVGKACATGADCPGSSCVTVSNACGDGDSFGDPGERFRIGLLLQNDTGIDLTGVSVVLATGDPDIQCVLDGFITIPDFPDGSLLDTRTLTPPDDPAQPADGRFFEVVIAPTATTTNPLQPARAEMGLTMNSNERGGFAAAAPFYFQMDLDVPPGAVIAPTPARCDSELTSEYAGLLCPGGDADCGGKSGACKPGLIYEDFESPGPNPGVPKPTGGNPQNNDFSNTIGFIERVAATDSDTTIAGKVCYGFIEILGKDPAQDCQIDPDFETDWHFEVSGPAPLPKAFHGTKSAHWGRHTNLTSRTGDTTALREIEAFETNPINLTILPGPGDLYLSFWHIVAFADDNRVGFKPGQSGDHADVQIAVDLDPTAAENFSRWTKLAPFQNLPEHTTQVFSWFGYCQFTPSDGAKSTNPIPYGETMCFPDPVWSHSGNVRGSNPLAIFNAQGPGHLGSAGEGVWVQTKFNLRDYLGQRVKIRWIGQSWDFGLGWNSYMDPPGGGVPFDLATEDDGWWIDSIQLTGAITLPWAPLVETGSIPLTNQCPATPAANCDESQGTSGFTIDFRLQDADGDGIIVQGESLVLDASQTANPGGCARGVPEYRFSRLDGSGTTILQEWSTATSIRLGNTADGDLYQVEARCGSDFSCTTLPTGPPVGAVPGGCRVFTGTVPLPVEPAVGFTLSESSSAMVMTQPNFLLTGPGTPPHLALPPNTYGHAFLRTDALSVGNGLPIGGSDGGLTGSCAGPQCIISETFRSVVIGGATSCPVLATQHPCNAPGPPVISWTDGTIPPVGTIYYYLGDVFTTPSGIGKVFGNAGASRTNSGPADRTANGTCPGPVLLP